ncbi:MAG TPA: squalene synthase [Balneola sp.]|jgi:15-cis-phytoene synthase|nr:squalene synthase [Balneola sp.]MAO78365.1 squalene synthase [Balneola sp.]MBF64365.1 squalene synthase [Balneola sp.]HAH50974.1 squalene synthase [Balneola sp.]HBZ38751.1 squalene synthase [Balneola sp.]|tara:strand:+ start:4183 stop:5157 length:975 start_codon:yes stop_codon:yes gene_type:complete
MTNLLQIPYSLFRPIYEMTSFHKSVIDDVTDEDLKLAYSHCRAITRYHAKTFYLATRFLPNEKQRGIFAIYGMCRYLDNLVDEVEDLIREEKLTLSEIDAKLDEFKKELDKVYSGYSVNDPILNAYADSLKRYKVPKELPLLLIEGVRQDLEISRFQNFQEIYDYSYKVASVVGLMTIEVFGYTSDEAIERATDLGIAMQLTNILRDVGEDLERGRIYIPKEDLIKFNVTEEELFAKNKSEKFIELMKFQISRARCYYDSAFAGIEMLNKDSRLPVYLAHRNYSRILEKIEENEYDVFNKRAFLNQSEKLYILPQVLLDLKKAV